MGSYGSYECVLEFRNTTVKEIFLMGTNNDDFWEYVDDGDCSVSAYGNGKMFDMTRSPSKSERFFRLLSMTNSLFPEPWRVCERIAFRSTSWENITDDIEVDTNEVYKNLSLAAKSKLAEEDIGVDEFCDWLYENECDLYNFLHNEKEIQDYCEPWGFYVEFTDDGIDTADFDYEIANPAVMSNHYQKFVEDWVTQEL